MLIEAQTPAILDVSTDPVSIQTDRSGLDAAVMLPYTPDIREPMWIQPPRNPEHGRHSRFAPTLVHRNSNANGARRMTATIDADWDIIRSEIGKKQVNA
jgi:hypothetical protein